VKKASVNARLTDAFFTGLFTCLKMIMFAI
jgi:hypothetical protein